MKYGHLTVILIALPLIAIAFMPIVAAEITPGNATYNVTMLGGKVKGKVILTIYTTDKFDGTTAHDIQLTVYDEHYNIITVTPADIAYSPDSITIYLQLGKEVPPHVTASHAVGFVGTTGETFYASGPGWGWANIH